MPGFSILFRRYNQPFKTVKLPLIPTKKKLVQYWEVKVDSVYTQKKIDNLKEVLSSSDYKVIKCQEASLIGEQMPYDVDELHKERQSIRDEINRLESLI